MPDYEIFKDLDNSKILPESEGVLSCKSLLHLHLVGFKALTAVTSSTALTFVNDSCFLYYKTGPGCGWRGFSCGLVIIQQADIRGGEALIDGFNLPNLTALVLSKL